MWGKQNIANRIMADNLQDMESAKSMSLYMIGNVINCRMAGDILKNCVSFKAIVRQID